MHQQNKTKKGHIKSRSHRWRFPRSATFAFWIFIIFISSIIARGISLRALSQGTDSAGFIELVKMPFPNFSLNNSALASHGLGLMSTFGLNADEICRFNANFEPSIVSHMSYHPYLVSILLGGLAKIPGADAIFISSFSIALSYVLGIYIIYIFLRKQRINNKIIAFWLTFLLICPVLFESLRGQLYFDRIFMGPGIGLIVGIFILKEDLSDKVGNRILLISIPLSIMISDRAAFSAAVILIILPISISISKRMIFNSKGFLLRTVPYGVFALVWYLIWTYFISDPFSSSRSDIFETLSFPNLENSITRLSGVQFPILVTFVGTILFFVVLSAWNRSSIPLLILTLLPSFLVDIGGAQFNGYLTHYHQLYIPVLISLATAGLVNILKVRNVKHASLKYVPQMILTLSVIATLTFWILNSTNSGSVNIFFGKVTQAYGVYANDRKVNDDLEKQLAPLATEFRKHDIHSISTLESLMPFVVKHTNFIIGYFPAGIGNTDAVLANYSGGSMILTVYPYYEPTPNVSHKVAECVQKELEDNYWKSIEIERNSSYKTVLYIRKGIKKFS